MNRYAILKTKYVEVSQVDEGFFIDFNEPYLVVGLEAPEAYGFENDELNRLNLKPYEYACRRFAHSDFQYSEVNINPAGRRFFLGQQKLTNTTPGSNTSIIICYITFDKP